MWVRKIGVGGNSKSIVLPPQALEALGWEKGDHIVIFMHIKDNLIMHKFDPKLDPGMLHDARKMEADSTAYNNKTIT